MFSTNNPKQLAIVSAYNLWLSSLNVTPYLHRVFQFMSNPKPGQLVMEISTIYCRDRDDTRLGRLLKTSMEPMYTREEARNHGYDDDEPIPEKNYWYIDLIFDKHRTFKWSNARFIAVPEDFLDNCLKGN